MVLEVVGGDVQPGADGDERAEEDDVAVAPAEGPFPVPVEDAGRTAG